MPDLFTIGYEGSIVDNVVAALREAGVTHLVDVRAVPQSRKPGFSKRLLGGTLAAAGIRYTHLRGLGTPKAGRDAARHGDIAGLHRIYAAHMQTLEAASDLERAAAIVAEGGACLLCFERDPACCHRSIVAGLLPGHPVRHLFAEPV